MADIAGCGMFEVFPDNHAQRAAAGLPISAHHSRGFGIWRDGYNGIAKVRCARSGIEGQGQILESGQLRGIGRGCREITHLIRRLEDVTRATNRTYRCEVNAQVHPKRAAD